MSTTFDRRRVQAPEGSHAPIFAPQPELLAGNNVEDASPSFVKTGLVTQANGSAYIEANGVKIACSVYGPRPKPPPYSPCGTLNLEVKFAPFASRVRRAPLRDTEPVDIAALLSELLLPALRLELFPKLSIDIHILVLEADSDAAVLSSGLTAACAAVADAGIPLTGLVVGSLIQRPNENGTGACKVTAGVMPALGTLTSLSMVGESTLDVVCDMIDTAVANAKPVHTITAQALVDKAGP